MKNLVFEIVQYLIENRYKGPNNEAKSFVSKDEHHLGKCDT